MAVPAIELKPRGPLALFDAAVRLVARSSGLWALTLPGGALVTWAVLAWVDAISRAQALMLPTLLLALAWIARGVFMAAACAYLDQQLLSPTPSTTWGALRAALRRLPSVVITAVYLPVFTALTLTFTLGIGFFFVSSHLAGWAAVMKGVGHPLSLYGTCARLLGPARGSTVVIRILFGVIVLVTLNLHIAANALIYVARKLVGIDLTYAQRFASLDNAAWVAVVLALAFTAFEPLRAAVATLLLIDGRVRQEGLDLLASVEQLPRRSASAKTRSAGLAALLAVMLFGGVAAEARAQTAEPPQALVERLNRVAQDCEYESHVLDHELGGAEALAAPERRALRRLVEDVELFSNTWEDCDAVVARLDAALPLLSQTVQKSRAAPDAEGASARAQAILSRPEFAPPPPAVAPQEKPAEEEESWWSQALDRFFKWLKDLLESDRERTATPPSSLGAGLGAANAVAMVLLFAVIAVIGVLLFLAFRGKGNAPSSVEVERTAAAAAAAASDNALARPPEGWAALADELAARGNFREAVRSLYLALLARLHGVGAIDYDPTLSNQDYCRRFRGKGEWVPAFRELTSRFDFAWYGKAEVGEQGYLAFRQLTEPMLRAEQPLGSSSTADGGSAHA